LSGAVTVLLPVGEYLFCMEPLTARKIIDIHHEVVEEFRGVEGILAEATLDYLVFKADRISDPFKKAALALCCIVEEWIEHRVVRSEIC